ncbi:MAG: sugar ABC transporter permease [Propionibacteriaceae bacterium]|jgi:multiple sugar transport system permease protein|nr:sugar ABC transporter permease [Propionibacteriaceae bacterium]
MSMAAAPALAEQPARAQTARKGKPTKAPKNDLKPALLFILPAAIGFLVFFIYPAIKGFYYSFTDFELLGDANWVGLENYQTMLSDELFWNALWVTLEYVVINIGVQTLVALLLAVLMQRLTTSLLVRGVLLLPYLIANVVVALVWYWMCNQLIGIINIGLEAIGVEPQAFFGSPVLSIPTIALVNVWRYVGYTALLIFAGLQTIPPQLYEAAAIDGAGEVKAFFKITLPLLRPVLAMVLVVTITGSFQIFDTVAVTTAGGPVNATRVIYYYIYDLAFNRYHFGYASTLTVALFLILALVSFFQLKLMRADQTDLD